MKRLEELVGQEHLLDASASALRNIVRDQNPARVGAMQITCSDESERECVEAFQHRFVEDQLPALSYSNRSPYRTATLGGRYEWGSAALAEDRFSLPAGQSGLHLLLIKINAHVAVVRDGSTFSYGTMDCYEEASHFCGALHAVLQGQQLPAIRNLSETFRSEGLDRVAMLNDPSQVEPRYRSLLAAVASARLQARRATLDVQNSPHRNNTLIMVLPCVTMNRVDRDTELVVGAYTADFRSGQAEIRYAGLGDDPSKYQVELRHNLLTIEDDQLGRERQARDHRKIVLSKWQKRDGEVLIDDDKVREIVVLTERASPSSAVAKEVLKTLLRMLADIALVPTAILLFVDGVAGIHNCYRAYRLATGTGTRYDATSILDEILARVDALSPQQARAVIAKLCSSYGISLEHGYEGEGEVGAESFVAESFAAESFEIAIDEATDEEAPPQPATELPNMADAADAKKVVARTASAAEPAIPSQSQSLQAEGALSLDAQPLMSSTAELGAGSSLQFSSMPEPELSLSAGVSLGESERAFTSSLGDSARQASTRKAASLASPTGQGIADMDVKPIVDDAKEVTAVDTPEIAIGAAPIVDTAKAVTDVATPAIGVVDEKIEDESPEIAVQTEAIALEEVQIAQPADARTLASSIAPSIPTSPLRESHVVQPSRPRSTSPMENDSVIEAELIPVDEADDGIIIIDENSVRER